MTILLTRKTKQTNYSAPLNLNAAQRSQSAAIDMTETKRKDSVRPLHWSCYAVPP
jgi:hypothetical protein